jgi:hypothetical protein
VKRRVALLTVLATLTLSNLAAYVTEIVRKGAEG